MHSKLICFFCKCRRCTSSINSGVAAGIIYSSEKTYDVEPLEEIKIAFDGDAVIFSDASEKIYKEQGLEAFLAHEKENAKKPLAAGPFAKLLRTLAALQKEFWSRHIF